MLNLFFNPLKMQASLLLPPRERSRFILSTLKHLCREPRFQHQWRPADHLAALCNKWFTIPEPLQFTGNDLNSALLRDPVLKLDIRAEKLTPNQFGIYHDTCRPMDTKKVFIATTCVTQMARNASRVSQWEKHGNTLPQDFDEEIQAVECATRNQAQ